MGNHRFHLVNVFADSPLSGNALCVFEDGEPFTDEEMQAIALQFNLSETTFLFPSSNIAAVRVRIFTPSFEMPFAGHPSLGSAHVARLLGRAGDALSLETKAGVIPVTASGDVWTLQAKAPKHRPVAATRVEIAAMLGLREADVGHDSMWIDTGSEQLVVPLTSAQAVTHCQPDPRLLVRYGSNNVREGFAYAWAHDGPGRIASRFFFLKHGALVEDPGTGSACANLGGWFVETGRQRPLEFEIHQGEATGRPCKLGLRVDESGNIFVTGRVVAVGTGELTL